MGSIVGWSVVFSASAAPLQAGALGSILNAPGALRAIGAAVAVLVLGGALLWRSRGFVRRATRAASSEPLRGLAYGVAAHLVIVFAGVYLASRLSGYQAVGLNGSTLGLLVGVLLMLGVAALGFTVVGGTVADLAWDGDPWSGLVVGALVAGVVAALDTTVGPVVWLVVVSLGIGGAVERWLHASMDPET